MNLPKDVAQMLEAYFAGDPSPEVIAQMEAWLSEDHANARILAEYGLIDRLIGHEQKKEDASAIFASLLEAEESAQPLVVSLQEGDEQSVEDPGAETISFKQAFSVLSYFAMQRLRRNAVAVISIAAALLFATVLIIALPSGQTEPQQDQPIAGTDPESHDAIATITAIKDAQWQAESGAALPGIKDVLHAGQRLTLTEGFAEITTRRGAVAVLEAPSTIELVNDNAVRLDSGKMVCICQTETSKGFMVQTPDADITDLGTEFGVEVLNNRVITTVFSGIVEVAPLGGEVHRLVRNQTALLYADQDRLEFVIEEQLASGFTQRIPRDELTTSVRLLGVEGYTPQILSQGFWEGAKPYTDRDFVIKSIVPEGLPTALLGGDLIQMPGDLRTRIDPAGESLRLELELAQPSDVYILMSERQKPADWLKRDYELTSWPVGMMFNKQRTDTYHVWRRKAPVSGRAVVAQSADSSMYSVVVVPRTHTTR